MKNVWSGNHFSVIEVDEDWEAVHEPDMILALPIVDGEYVIRKEHCPSYNVKDNEEFDRFWTPVSGGIEDGESPVQTLKREMGEETPVKPLKIRLIDRMEEIPFVKLTTSRVSFYHFEVLKYEETTAPGDGSEIEKKSKYQFVDYSELQQIANQPNADLLISFMAKIANEDDT